MTPLNVVLRPWPLAPCKVALPVNSIAVPKLLLLSLGKRKLIVVPAPNWIVPVPNGVSVDTSAVVLA